MATFTRARLRRLSKGLRPADRGAPVAQRPLLPVAYETLAARTEVPLRDIVLLSRHAPVRIANELARRYPGCTVHLLNDHSISAERLAGLSSAVTLHETPDVDSRMTALAGLPAPQLIIEIAADLDRQLARLAELFYFLQDGGIYVLHHRPRRVEGEQPTPAFAHPSPLVALEVVAAGRHRDLLGGELLASCSTVDLVAEDDSGESVAFLGKRFEHRMNLREGLADERLTRRFGTSWGVIVAERPARQFGVTANVTEHGDRGAWHGQTEHPVVADTMDVPRMALRRYDDVVCWPQQRVAKGEFWLPDTFRHPCHQRLEHGKLIAPNPWQSRLKDTADVVPRTVDGPLFYLDTEYPGHFGHVLTEVVSRLWGWPAAQRLAPGLRPLVTRPAGADGIPAFQRDLFRALGIDPDDIEYLDKGEAVAVSQLYAASPMLSMPYYASPELADTWSTVGAALRGGGQSNRAGKLFVARRVGDVRSCTNTREVEAFFQDLGFEFFYPEDHSFAEQVAAFAGAEIIAGFAGSNMFTAMFAGPKRMLVITGDSYNASNEYFIAAVNGGDLHYVIGDSEHKHPPDRWTWLAYMSNFTVDLDRLGPEMRAVLAAWDKTGTPA